MVWSQQVIVALAIIPKVSSCLSIAGSCYIFQEVCRSPGRRKQPYHRLLAGLSVADFIASVGSFLGTWPIPKGTPGVYGAVGTQQTCEAAGFFNVWNGPVTPMYNAALAFYYLASVRYNWNDRKIAQYEQMAHVVFWSIGLGCAITALSLGLLNNSDNWVCWIEHKPLGCLDSFRHGKEMANCERGDNAYIYQWAFYFCFGWLSFLIMIGCLTSVYFAVLTIEKRRDSYRFPSSDQDFDRSKSRKVFEQGVLYGCAFVITWIFQTLSRILFLTTGEIFVAVTFLVAIFLPLQGFWNFLIYRRRACAAFLASVAAFLCCRRRRNSDEDGGATTTTDAEPHRANHTSSGTGSSIFGFKSHKSSHRVSSRDTSSHVVNASTKTAPMEDVVDTNTDQRETATDHPDFAPADTEVFTEEDAKDPEDSGSDQNHI